MCRDTDNLRIYMHWAWYFEDKENPEAISHLGINR